MKQVTQVIFKARLLSQMAASVFAFSLLSFSLSAQALNPSQSSLNDIQKKIDKLEKALDNTKEQKVAATEALKASEVAISKSKKKLHELAIEAKQNAHKRSELSTQLAETQAKLSQQKSALSKQLYHQYTLGEQDYLQLILKETSPAERSRDMAYFSYLNKAHTRTIAGLQNNLTQLTTLNTEIESAIETAEALKAAQEAQQKTLTQQKQKKAKVVTLLASKVDKQRSAIDKLKQDEKSLTKLMVKLEKQRAANKKKAQQKAIATNKHEPDNANSGKPFNRLRGQLRLPTIGKVLNQFGQQRTETGIKWKGLFIKAKEGANVKSVAQGKVVFSNWMRGFGNLIIVDHGQGYMSLYGNNQSLFKSVGDSVKGGDVIAAVGNSGGNKNTGLYYELRNKSKPFNPLPWSKF